MNFEFWKDVLGLGVDIGVRIGVWVKFTGLHQGSGRERLKMLVQGAGTCAAPIRRVVGFPGSESCSAATDPLLRLIRVP